MLNFSWSEASPELSSPDYAAINVEQGIVAMDDNVA
jgi:hypothetical protein